jgi:hypothetical protein
MFGYIGHYLGLDLDKLPELIACMKSGAAIIAAMKGTGYRKSWCSAKSDAYGLGYEISKSGVGTSALSFCTASNAALAKYPDAIYDCEGKKPITTVFGIPTGMYEIYTNNTTSACTPCPYPLDVFVTGIDMKDPSAIDYSEAGGGKP